MYMMFFLALGIGAALCLAAIFIGIMLGKIEV
jgi:hypothetical protein